MLSLSDTHRRPSIRFANTTDITRHGRCYRQAIRTAPIYSDTPCMTISQTSSNLLVWREHHVEIAIEENAIYVRVDTAIFGPRS